MLHSICYISNATNLLDEVELRKLFEYCTEANGLRGITGVLIYKDGTFIQFLEGEKDEVSSLFETIRSDFHHNQITKVLDRSINQTIFKDYKTGFGGYYNENELLELNNFIEDSKKSEYVRSVRALLHPFIGILA